MKKIALALTLALASMAAAQAQTTEAVVTPVAYQPVAAKPLRFVLGAGLTFGGDKIATAYYEDGDEIDLRAGDMVAVQAGIDYRVSPEFSLKATVGYHVDDASARNGDMRFQRVPFELLGYYHVTEKVRVGGGLRYVTGAEFRSSGAGDIGDYKFKNTTSAVAELEYMATPSIGVTLRYVNDEYEEKGYGGKLKGDHVGAFANFYF
jgi:hypothetical protein